MATRRTTDETSLDRRAFLTLAAGAAAMPLASRNVSAKSSQRDELTTLTLEDASRLVRQRDISPVELTRACLARIEKYDSQINAFITVTPELALEQARLAEKEIRRGRWRGPLHGIPLALKDHIDTAGVRTTNAAAAFVDRIPNEDAEVVRRLKRAGAVLLGKLNLGMGSESHWGAVHNPWSLEHECGYSSCGPAAAVAADFCFGALGTDSAGSVRIPASACGVVGLMPTLGLISNRGVTEDPLTRVGTLTKSVLDTAFLLEGIVGPDSNRIDSQPHVPPSYVASVSNGTAPPRLGIPRAGFFESLDQEVAQLVSKAVDTLATIATLVSDEIKIGSHWEILEALAAERFFASLEKIASDSQPFLGERLASRPRESVRSVQYANPHLALQQARLHTADIFANVDLLVLPTWKRLPMTLALRTWPLPKEEFMQELWNTLPFNVLGLPALSVPCGISKAGLPVGLQIVGPAFSEALMLAFARAYEHAAATPLHRPKLMTSGSAQSQSKSGLLRGEQY